MAFAQQQNESCTLDCRNNGVCKFGVAEFGFASEFQDDQDPLPFSQQDHVNGMHCECPKGFTGVRCEIVFKICGDNEHKCFNGADCIKSQSDQGETFFHCECDGARSDLSQSYAGNFCQHEATTFCAVPVEGSEAPPRHTFCTNGGRCKEIVQAHEV